MQVYLNFENFGKIKEGHINISNLSIFVGENNSGKTYVMQLIYAVINEICQEKVFSDNILDDKYESDFELDEELLSSLVKSINRFLDLEKNAIIEKTFHRSINIEKLWIEIKLEDSIFQIKHNEIHLADEAKEKKLDRYTIVNCEYGVLSRFAFRAYTKENHKKKFICSILVSLVLGVRRTFRREADTIFFPASRTGMLLLYKYFFSEKDRQQSEYELFFDEDDEKRNEMGLTVPVYDFLQFLLRYTQNDRESEKNSEIINFIQDKLIDGKLLESGNETLYQTNNGEYKVPLYLTSSMVNELTPVLKLLTGSRRYSFVFYDEIETCLHPEKQKEMARLIVRLNNSGYKMIISTHSDTMASKLNNLMIFSRLHKADEKRFDDICQKTELSSDDVLTNTNVNVYQFTNNEDGTSSIKKIEYSRVPDIGFEFEQFNKSALDLYRESNIVMGD